MLVPEEEYSFKHVLTQETIYHGLLRHQRAALHQKVAVMIETLYGDALVHIRAGDSNASEYELHTGDEARATITHAGLRIQLVNLQPYPFSSRTIEPQDYRATLRVAR